MIIGSTAAKTTWSSTRSRPEAHQYPCCRQGRGHRADTAIPLTLEYAVEFIARGRTGRGHPQSIRLRKRYLKEQERKRAAREETLPV